MDLRSQQRVQSEPRPATAAPTSAPAPSQSRRGGGKQGLGSKRTVIVALVALLVVAGLVFAFMSWQSGLGAIKRDKYQAVFLTNGQVYFGKIDSMTSETVVLKEVYYLQQAANPQKLDSEDDAAKNQLSLIKLGKEIHAPENTMYLERSQMVFWENLTDEGQVVKTIEQDKQQQN